MDKGFLRSKKAWNIILAAVTIIWLAYLGAPAEAYWAVAAVFGGHQLAQGGQDTARTWRSSPAAEKKPPGELS